MSKINKSKIRQEIAESIADKFIKSGKPYTCLACVFEFKPYAREEANILLSRGINLSKSGYQLNWAENMACMFLMDAAEIIHKHFYPD